MTFKDIHSSNPPLGARKAIAPAKNSKKADHKEEISFVICFFSNKQILHSYPHKARKSVTYYPQRA